MAARRIVITGGSAGIGLATAQCLRDRGHHVFICGRDAGRLDAALDELAKCAGSGRVGGLTCDVRDFGQVTEMIEVARRNLGSVDCLVNNAGIAFIKDFADISPEVWAEIVNTNLTGVFNCCRAALPHLKAAAADGGNADIVNVGSRSGRYAYRGGVGYNTTKFGLQGFTEALFLDLNRYGIRVSLVAPGTVATGLGGTAPADWHLKAADVGEAIAGVIAAKSSVCVNWVELRPARPPG